MATRTVDIYALGALLGYTPAQMSSVRDIHIAGDTHQVTVTRFVQDPGSQPPRRTVPKDYDAESDNHCGVGPLVANDIFGFRPSTQHCPVAPEYLVLPKTVVTALAKMQWG